MQTSSFETPGLFGDHHVTEVRKQLLALPGVQSVYASSAFRVIEVTHDENQVNGETLRELLEGLGYLSEIPILAETGAFTPGSEGRAASFRHSTSYITTKKVVSFQQNVPFSGRPLWNCPGMGVVKPTDRS